MRISLGCDHAGYVFKVAIRDYLQTRGHEVRDLGADSSESVDYPVYGAAVARDVAAGRSDFGILICGTGIGMSMTANKVPGIRAGLCHTPDHGRLTREHNDANVLCLGARGSSLTTALETVDAFLAADFEGGRHERRVNLIRELEWPAAAVVA